MDSRRLLKFLNGYIHRQNDKNDIVTALKVNGVEVTEKKEIADSLNLHLVLWTKNWQRISQLTRLTTLNT